MYLYAGLNPRQKAQSDEKIVLLASFFFPCSKTEYFTALRRVRQVAG